MTMKHNRHLSTCVYMSIIAINDNIVLTLAFHKWFVENVVAGHSKWLCKAKLFSVHVFACYGAFQIVLMTLDKVIAIKLPHRSASICTAKRARLLSLINFIIVIILYLPILDFSNTNERQNDCIRYAKDGWYVTAYSYFAIVVNPLLPIALLFVMNIIIIMAVWESQRLRQDAKTGQQHSRNRTTEIQLTIMLILVSSMFIILLLPFESWTIYLRVSEKFKTPREFARFTFIFNIVYELYMINYGINFYLYLVSGRKFRADLISLFKRKPVSQNSSSGQLSESRQTVSERI